MGRAMMSCCVCDMPLVLTSLRLQALGPGTSTLPAFGSRSQNRHTQFCSARTWNWRGKWLFILALNSADQLVLFYRSGLVTLPLTAEEEGWGGERECVCLCVSACHGRRGGPVEAGCFWIVRNEPRVSLQYNFLVTLIILVCNLEVERVKTRLGGDQIFKKVYILPPLKITDQNNECYKKIIL